MDLDGNGSIDADELGLILKSFGEAVPASRLKALIREVRNVRYGIRGSGSIYVAGRPTVDITLSPGGEQTLKNMPFSNWRNR